jgi:hypothetical protein
MLHGEAGGRVCARRDVVFARGAYGLIPPLACLSCFSPIPAPCRQLAAQLHMGEEEAEKWIVDLIRSAQIDARLDAKTSSLQMMQPDTTL